MNQKRREVKQQRKQMVDDRLKRINMKSKRKRTIIKKVIEFSQMCNVGVLLVIHDAEYHKVIEYNSGTAQKGGFSSADAFRALEAARAG